MCAGACFGHGLDGHRCRRRGAFISKYTAREDRGPGGRRPLPGVRGDDGARDAASGAASRAAGTPCSRPSGCWLHRWYKHAHQAIVHQRTEGYEGDATPFEVPFFHYVEKVPNNRAAFQKQLLEAHPEKFVALVRIAAASATTGGYADNLYHASIPITVVDDDSSADLIRKFKESKPPTAPSDPTRGCTGRWSPRS